MANYLIVSDKVNHPTEEFLGQPLRVPKLTLDFPNIGAWKLTIDRAEWCEVSVNIAEELAEAIRQKGYTLEHGANA